MASASFLGCWVCWLPSLPGDLQACCQEGQRMLEPALMVVGAVANNVEGMTSLGSFKEPCCLGRWRCILEFCGWKINLLLFKS